MSTGVFKCYFSSCTLQWIFQHIINQHGGGQGRRNFELNAFYFPTSSCLINMPPTSNIQNITQNSKFFPFQGIMPTSLCHHNWYSPIPGSAPLMDLCSSISGCAHLLDFILPRHKYCSSVGLELGPIFNKYHLHAWNFCILGYLAQLLTRSGLDICHAHCALDLRFFYSGLWSPLYSTSLTTLLARLFRPPCLALRIEIHILQVPIAAAPYP